MHTSKLSALSLSLCLLLFLASPAFAAGGSSGAGSEAQGPSGNESVAECDGSQVREGSGEQEASYGQSQYSPSYDGGDDCDGEGQTDPVGPEAKEQDRSQERIRQEKHEGEYPEDPHGTGDRNKERTRTEERSFEPSSSAEPTESVESTGGIDVDVDATDETAVRGSAVTMFRSWLEGALSFFAGLFS